MTIDGPVPPRARRLAAATSTLTVMFLVAYAAVVRSQDGSGPAWWFVAVLTIAALVALAAAVTGRVRLLMPGCAVLLGICAFLGLLSVGVLLLPATATATASIVVAARRPATA